MKRNCKVVVKKGDPYITQSMSVYPTTWADLAMDVKESQAADSKVYELKGELIEVSGDKGCIALKNGLLLYVPLYCIQLIDIYKEPASSGQALPDSDK